MLHEEGAHFSLQIRRGFQKRLQVSVFLNQFRCRFLANPLDARDVVAGIPHQGKDLRDLLRLDPVLLLDLRGSIQEVL